jgi:hypothetical protein
MINLDQKRKKKNDKSVKQALFGMEEAMRGGG